MHAPNETHPLGVCVSQALQSEVPFENINGQHVATTAHFLGARNAEWSYVDRVGADQQFVRCAAAVPLACSPLACTAGCPAPRTSRAFWSYLSRHVGCVSGAHNCPVHVRRGSPVEVYDFEFNITREELKFEGGYETQFFFNHPFWSTGRSSGARVLQRVELSGSHAIDGSAKVPLPALPAVGHPPGSVAGASPAVRLTKSYVYGQAAASASSHLGCCSGCHTAGHNEGS